MGAWGAGIGAAGGLLGALGKDKVSNQAYDTSRVIDTGDRSAAINAGNTVLNALPQNFNTAQGFATSGASSLANAANSPDIGASQNYFRNTLNGMYLNGSPQQQNFWNSIRNSAMTTAADQNARARSQAALAGGNPTGSFWGATQAANTAAANNAANNSILGAQAQNYQFERGLQNQASQGLFNALSEPGQLFGAASNLQLAPSLQAGQALQANYIAPWTMGIENVLTKTPDALKTAGNALQGISSGAMGGATGGLFGGGQQPNSVPATQVLNPSGTNPYY